MSKLSRSDWFLRVFMSLLTALGAVLTAMGAYQQEWYGSIGLVILMTSLVGWLGVIFGGEQTQVRSQPASPGLIEHQHRANKRLQDTG